MPDSGEDGDEGEENDHGSSSPSTSLGSTLQVASQLQGLRRSLVATQNLQETLASIDRMQREVAEPVRQVEEVTETVRGVEQMRENVIEPIRELQRTVDAATQPFAELQQTVSAIQSARAFTQAYNQQWAALRETLEDLRDGIRVAVEDQIRLEMPWEYESVDPDPAAKAVAENWASQFLEELEDVDDDYFARLSTRMEDGLQEFQDDPERPYAAIHIFISMQDALLWWLCYQDNDITTEATNDIDLPKYGTDEKQDALRKYYQAYFGVEEDDPARISDFKWDCFWAHRHAIMHGDQYATYDMNIATTALDQPPCTSSLIRIACSLTSASSSCVIISRGSVRSASTGSSRPHCSLTTARVRCSPLSCPPSSAWALMRSSSDSRPRMRSSCSRVTP